MNNAALNQAASSTLLAQSNTSSQSLNQLNNSSGGMMNITAPATQFSTNLQQQKYIVYFCS